MTQPTPVTSKHHVVVVGAGISGLRCAGVLLDQGFKVTVVEARARLGGRICQSDTSALGYTVDLGPNWIHGSGPDKPHPILELASATDTPVVDISNSTPRLILPSGSALPAPDADRFVALAWDLLAKAVTYSREVYDAHAHSGPGAIPSDRSIMDFVREEVRRGMGTGTGAGAVDGNAQVGAGRGGVTCEEDAQLVETCAEVWGAFVGAQADRQSLRWAWLEACCVAGEKFVDGLFTNILEPIASRVRHSQSAEIQCSTLVTRISSSESPPTIALSISSAANGTSTLAADAVVVTSPLGWLKRNHSATFSPPLPERIVRAIDNMTVSHLEKVYITFPSVWWRCPECECESKSDSKSDSKSSPPPAYFAWHHPLFSSPTNPTHANVDIWDLSQAPSARPMLICYTYPPLSTDLVGRIHKLPPDEKFTFLRDFFKPYIETLPGYSADKKDCVPSGILASEWAADELAGNASYTNFQIGLEDVIGDVAALREGCETRRIWFCGEHVSPTEDSSTVTGAYWSGEEAAKRVIESAKTWQSKRIAT